MLACPCFLRLADDLAHGRFPAQVALGSIGLGFPEDAAMRSVRWRGRFPGPSCRFSNCSSHQRSLSVHSLPPRRPPPTDRAADRFRNAPPFPDRHRVPQAACVPEWLGHAVSPAFRFRSWLHSFQVLQLALNAAFSTRAFHVRQAGRSMNRHRRTWISAWAPSGRRSSPFRRELRRAPPADGWPSELVRTPRKRAGRLAGACSRTRVRGRCQIISVRDASPTGPPNGLRPDVPSSVRLDPARRARTRR